MAKGPVREMGLLGRVATGVCSMIGAGINVIAFMIQRHVPGIVMAAGSIPYRRETQALRRQGVDLDARFSTLSPGCR